MDQEQVLELLRFAYEDDNIIPQTNGVTTEKTL